MHREPRRVPAAVELAARRLHRGRAARALSSGAIAYLARVARRERAPGGGGWVSTSRSGERLVTREDLPWILGLVGAGLALRLLYWSGYGLGDDVIFRWNIETIVRQNQVAPDNMAYRFTWWAPTALSCHLLGLNEVGLILPITLMATAGMVVVYAFGKALWGRPGAVIATLLVLVCPLDFAWSTMLVNDFFLAVFSATTMLLVLRAPLAPDVSSRRRLWILAGVSLWLGFHAKVSVLMLFPAIAVVCFARRHELDREFLYF